MAESADASDLKSDDGDIVWVRPPLALLKNPGELFPGFLFFFPCGRSPLYTSRPSVSAGFVSDQILYFPQILHDKGLFSCRFRGTAFRKEQNAFNAGIDRAFNIQ